MMQEVARIKKSNSSKELWRVVIAVNLIVFGFIMTPMVAFAQPTNDDFDYATVIGTPLPFTDSISTTDATIANDDPTCIYEQDHTVWYAFTPSSDMRYEVNSFNSDYDTVLSVYTGSRGELEEIACNDDAAMTLQSRVRFDAIAETTYYIMVGSLGRLSAGGNLFLTVDVAPPSPPPLTIELNIDPVGSVNLKNMVTTISGTLTCSRQANTDLSIGLVQRAGRDIIHGYSYNSFECDGETPWKMTVTDDDGVFAGGKATVNANVFVYDPDEDEFYFSEAIKTVQLKGKKL